MTARLRERLDSLPAAPGVYVMKDGGGGVVYVGKAKNLRARVRSYFVRAGDGRAFVPLLGRLVADVETLVVRNEKEALLLESELVGRLQPRFNARLRGGRHFVYLRVDERQRWPRFEVVRRVAPDGARYFGPYPLATALRESLRFINRTFGLRVCADHDARRHGQRACLLCQIARFPVYDAPPDEYRRRVEAAIRLLSGDREVLESLRGQMAAAVAAQRFEEAARLRDRLAALEQTLEPQSVVER